MSCSVAAKSRSWISPVEFGRRGVAGRVRQEHDGRAGKQRISMAVDELERRVLHRDHEIEADSLVFHLQGNRGSPLRRQRSGNLETSMNSE